MNKKIITDFHKLVFSNNNRQLSSISLGQVPAILNKCSTSNLMNSKKITCLGLTHSISFSFASKPHSQQEPKLKREKVREKYLNDYLFFKSVPFDVRPEQLQRISMMPSSSQQYPSKFQQSNKHKEEWFQYNGIKLKSYIWQPSQTPKAVLVCYHSLNGHSLMISQFAQKMAKSGYLVAALDYPNFGKSEGQKKGKIESFGSIAQPSEKYFYQIKKRYPYNKIYMMGNSLGGSVAFCLSNRLTNKELNGVILLSPAIRENPFHIPFKKKLAAILASTFPNFKIPKSNVRNGCKYRLDEYLKSDPYIYKEGMWAVTAWTMVATMLNFAKQFRQLEKPYLMVQSGMDKLCDPFLAIDLERVSPSKDKTTVIIHDMWHNVWFDDKKQEVGKIILEWLQERNH